MERSQSTTSTTLQSVMSFRGQKAAAEAEALKAVEEDAKAEAEALKAVAARPTPEQNRKRKDTNEMEAILPSLFASLHQLIRVASKTGDRFHV
jgi:hypothetical protein